jgi:hypothetical protein
MKKSHFSGFVLLLGMQLASGALATAQDNASASTQSNSANKKASSAKAKKTWTEDDVAALHSPADSYRDQQQAQVQGAGDVAKNPASAQETSALNEPPRDKPPLLSDPKTVESADKMIAWEDRDIAAQEEFVARLKTQLETAAPEARDHLENLIVERQKIILDTRKERDGLIAQKRTLEKKHAANSTISATETPQ